MSAEVLSVAVRRAVPGFALDVEAEIPLAGVTAVFGPSGGGKTTLLRLIAGFDRPDAGRVAFGGETWCDGRVHAPAHKRPVGTVFQDARLFPHRDVRGNLAFAEKRGRADGGRFAFDAVVAAFDLAPLLDRRIGGLSGGETRRVAIARTLLTAPRLLLLDEPLAGLDAARKADILPFLEDLPRRFGVPTLYVSHDVDEVARLADRILVLDNGRVAGFGPAAEIINARGLEPTAGRYEASTLFEGTVARHDPRLRLTHVDLAGETVSLAELPGLAEGAPVRLRIRARDVALATAEPEGLSIRNVLAGTVAEIAPEPDTPFADVLVALPAGRLRARLTRAAVEDLALEPGRAVWALVKSVSFDGPLG